MKLTFGLLLLFALAATAPGPRHGGKARPPAAEKGWQALDAGLDFGRFVAPRPSRSGDSRVHVLRIDPKRFRLTLENASAGKGSGARTAREWARQRGLVAAINASMYQEDGKTSVSLMRKAGHVNNPRLSKDKTVLAFDPVRPDLPAVKMIDRECDDFADWKGRYRTFVQSIRMVSCKGENTWKPQPRSWSTAAVGVDRQGRVLFLHARSPWSTHDFIEILKALPIDLAQAQYAEGGPEAQLYVRHGGREIELVGGFGTSLLEGEGNPTAWPVPNVLGVVKRDRPLP